MNEEPKIRCGDTVLHKPSGETWVVAYAEDGRLSPSGWPACLAEIEDCEVVRRCTNEKHVKEVDRWINGPGSKNSDSRNDFRRGAIKRLYGHVLEGGVE